MEQDSYGLREPEKMNEREYIRANYGKIKTRQIALTLHRTPEFVRNVARRLGVARKVRRATTEERCAPCQMWINGTCAAHLENCTAARTIRARWPEPPTKWDYIE